MFFYIATIISIIGITIATYTDLKDRIVPNKLNYFLVITGLCLFGIQSILINSPSPLILSIFGLAFGFVFGWILWKIGVFAGGDVKLFMALGTLNPITPALINYGILTSLNVPIFPITLFINSLIGFLPYGLIIIIIRLKQKKRIRNKIFKNFKNNLLKGIKGALLLAGLYSIFSMFSINILIEITMAIILAFFIEKRLKKISFLFWITGIIINPFLFTQITIGLIIMYIILNSSVKIMFSIGDLLEEKVKIDDLEEGMIPSKTIVWENEKVKEIDSFNFTRIINAIKKGKPLHTSEEKTIISSIKARGLNEEELKNLKTLKKEGKIKDTIGIKESMAFVPTILLGYILCLLIGDLILILLMG